MMMVVLLYWIVYDIEPVQAEAQLVVQLEIPDPSANAFSSFVGRKRQERL
jgi:hypothetical protein